MFLDGPADLIRARMAGRTGHYMPEALFASQLRALERPGADETDVQRASIEMPASEFVRRAAVGLRAVDG